MRDQGEDARREMAAREKAVSDEFRARAMAALNRKQRRALEAAQRSTVKKQKFINRAARGSAAERGVLAAAERAKAILAKGSQPPAAVDTLQTVSATQTQISADCAAGKQRCSECERWECSDNTNALNPMRGRTT